MASKAATWAAFGAVVKRSIAKERQTQPRAKLPYTPTRAFTTTRIASQNAAEEDGNTKPAAAAPKRKASRTQSNPSTLKRLTIEAQRSRQRIIHGSGKRAHVNPDFATKDVTAYCAAESYDLSRARQALASNGYRASTDLAMTGDEQVLHIRTIEEGDGKGGRVGPGDVFVFPSGTVVTWNVPDLFGNLIVERWLPKAAGETAGHLDMMEVEDMEFIEDPSREHSKIVGDTIILGAKAGSSTGGNNAEDHADDDATATMEGAGGSTTTTAAAPKQPRRHAPPATDTLLAKLSFSSALARSTKLAVLESRLTSYFTSTRTIPLTLSAGKRLPFSRAFILQKTGELLSIRAQLNLYSELTDSLPDLFWDSPHELGLEGYYEQMGEALDVGVRIRVLNERMDYASEIAAVLRERLSEKHSTELEWLIIGLITIEVIFGIHEIWKAYKESTDPESTEAMMREWLKKELKRT